MNFFIQLFDFHNRFHCAFCSNFCVGVVGFFYRELKIFRRPAKVLFPRWLCFKQYFFEP